MDDDKRLAASNYVQAMEANEFDIIHPELFNQTESRITTDFLKRLSSLTGDLSEISVLDLACGTGRMSLPLLNAGMRVVSVDLSEDMLRVLRSKVGDTFSERHEIVCDEIFNFLFSSKKDFDVIVLGAFLHHVPDIEGLISLLKTRLKPEGYLFIQHEPDLRPKGIARFFARALERLDSIIFQGWYLLFKGKVLPRMKEYGLADVHTADGIDKSELEKLLEVNGYTIVSCEAYYSHKTRLVNFLDKHLFNWLPQFYCIAKKK